MTSPKTVAPVLLPLNNLLSGSLGKALRERLKEGYRFAHFKADVMAGLVVGMIAIPLGMALAIASGVAPQYGLYTVIIAGALIPLLGGSRCQVSGPTAAFVVILAPIVQKFGLAGLLTAGAMAGVILILMGIARLGQLIRFIPNPVTTGFTSGIAVVIATIQLKDFFGLTFSHAPENYIGRISALIEAWPSHSLYEAGVGALTLLILLLWPQVNKRIPAPLIALTTVTLLVTLGKKFFPDLQIATIGSRFTYDAAGVLGHGIPESLPQFKLPWNFVGSDGKVFVADFASIQALTSSAFAIAMLGAIESLLSAVVADGMAQTKHDPNAELIAQGIGNVICPFFGGIAATGAIARTATNIRFGSQSPLSAFIHAIFALAVVLLFAPIVSLVPMASLAALLMLVAYNMSEAKHFFHTLRVAPKSDVIVLLVCFTLTIVFDMVVGVSVGIVSAALLFMKRMAGVTSGRMVHESQHHHLQAHAPLPKEILIYEIAGPMFFGAAESAIEAISAITDTIRTVIFVMDDVPIMDVTGLVSFESAISKLRAHKKQVMLVGVQQQPSKVLAKAGLFQHTPDVQVCSSLQEAIEIAKKSLGS